MKRKLSFALLLIVVISLFGSVFTVQAVDYDYHDFEPHAPYFINEWQTQELFDVLTVDWYCEIDGANTYWACQSFGLRNPAYTISAGGYAGFQTVDGKKKVLMSCWNISPQIRPKVEFAHGGINDYFDGEGEGQQVFTNFQWKPKTWYTMRIQARDTEDKTIIEQWVRTEEAEWILCGMISYPIPGLRLYSPSSFQEDFSANNVKRKQRLKNFYGRSAYDHQWYSLATQCLTNWYYEVDPQNPEALAFDLNDKTFNCDWGLKKDYLWIETGGGDYTPNGKSLPQYLTLDQPPLPHYKKFRLARNYLKKLKIEAVPDVKISWPNMPKKSDIVTQEFLTTMTVPGTEYHLFDWRGGKVILNFPEDEPELSIRFTTPGFRNYPILEWTNDKYLRETRERNAYSKATFDYPWRNGYWYTLRCQAWDLKGRTYIGYWIAARNNQAELLAIASYPEKGTRFKDPVFNTSHDSKNLHYREFRIRRTYAHDSKKNQWVHLDRYKMENSGVYLSHDLIDDYGEDFKGAIYSNIQSGRHGNYVWARVGGKKYEDFDRHYPFTFRIRDEKDKPGNPDFILTDIPEEYRP